MKYPIRLSCERAENIKDDISKIQNAKGKLYVIQNLNNIVYDIYNKNNTTFIDVYKDNTNHDVYEINVIYSIIFDETSSLYIFMNKLIVFNSEYRKYCLYELNNKVYNFIGSNTLKDGDGIYYYDKDTKYSFSLIIIYDLIISVSNMENGPVFNFDKLK